MQIRIYKSKLLNAVENGIFNYYIKLYVIQIKVDFFKFKRQKLEDFPMHCTVKLVHLTANQFKPLGGHLKWDTLATDNFL